MKNVFCMVAAFSAAAILLSNCVCAEPKVSAKSAIVIDGDTGCVLWEKNAYEQSLIASTTKIMTALLVAERCELDASVIVPEEAVGIEGSSIYLHKEELLSVEALLYGMMLHSGNDAAAALAIHCSGSVEAFVSEMNAKATELGLNCTSFANPHGLDSEGNYSTAYDLARLTMAAMKNDTFVSVVSSKTASFGNRTFTNHNKLLWQYDNAIGVKTGYTKAAGRILVSCAERNGRRLIAVTISAPDDWQDHRCMLDKCFSQYEEKCCVKVSDEFFVPLLSNSGGCAVAAVEEDVRVFLRKNERPVMKVQLPMFCGKQDSHSKVAGTVSFYVGDTEISRTRLIWKNVEMKGDRNGRETTENPFKVWTGIAQAGGSYD